MKLYIVFYEDMNVEILGRERYSTFTEEDKLISAVANMSHGNNEISKIIAVYANGSRVDNYEVVFDRKLKLVLVPKAASRDERP